LFSDVVGEIKAVDRENVEESGDLLIQIVEVAGDGRSLEDKP